MTLYHAMRRGSDVYFSYKSTSNDMIFKAFAYYYYHPVLGCFNVIHVLQSTTRNFPPCLPGKANLVTSIWRAFRSAQSAFLQHHRLNPPIFSIALVFLHITIA